MPGRSEVLKMTKRNRMNAKEELENTIWVSFKVGALGPFFVEVLDDPNFGTNMRDEIMKVVNNVNMVTS